MHSSKEIRELTEYAQTLGYRAEGTRDGVRFVHKVERVPIVVVHSSPSDRRAFRSQRADLVRGVRTLRCGNKDCKEGVPQQVVTSGDGFCSRVCFEKAHGIINRPWKRDPYLTSLTKGDLQPMKRSRTGAGTSL